MKQTQQGFTLIELMITVAIVGILASIAIPGYQKSANKSRRADAKGALMSFANAMERHYTETNSYCDAADKDGGGDDTCGDDSGTRDTGKPSIFAMQSPIDGSIKYYDLTIAAITPNSYTLQATRIGDQIGDDCGELTLTHTGKRDIIADQGSMLDAADCW